MQKFNRHRRPRSKGNHSRDRCVRFQANFERNGQFESLDTAIMLVTDIAFWHRNTGACQRIHRLIEYLSSSLNHFVLFYIGLLGDEDKRVCHELYPKLDVVYLPKRVAAEQAGRICAVPPEAVLKDYYSLEVQRCFQTVCEQLRPRVIIVEYLCQAYVLERLSLLGNFRPLTIIDTHDVMYKRAQDFHYFRMPHWLSITRNEEQQVISQFDVVLAITHNDADEFRRMVPNKKVLTVGHSDFPRERRPRHSSSLFLTFVGSDSAANRDAINWFLNEVWPRVWRTHGDQVSLQIVGGVSISLTQSSVPEGVFLLGEVQHLKTVYGATDIVIAPLRFGGGVNIKSIEALCNSLPLVTTSIGARGLEGGSGRAYFISDVHQEMSRVICDLLDSPSLRQKVSREAYLYATKHLTSSNVYSNLLEILRNPNLAHGHPPKELR